MATPEKQPSRRGQVRAETRASSHRGGSEPYLIFLSHATYDKWIAKILCEKIEGLGAHVKTFRDDRDIEGGERISNEIRSAMSSCREMIVLLTPESITRDWIKIEIGMAFKPSETNGANYYVDVNGTNGFPPKILKQ